MKKAITLEIWVDESLEDAKDCVNDVYNDMCTSEYLSDGSIQVKIVEKTDFLKGLKYANQLG